MCVCVWLSQVTLDFWKLSQLQSEISGFFVRIPMSSLQNSISLKTEYKITFVF